MLREVAHRFLVPLCHCLSAAADALAADRNGGYFSKGGGVHSRRKWTHPETAIEF
jgi:hypothetical protein